MTESQEQRQRKGGGESEDEHWKWLVIIIMGNFIALLVYADMGLIILHTYSFLFSLKFWQVTPITLPFSQIPANRVRWLKAQALGIECLSPHLGFLFTICES